VSWVNTEVGCGLKFTVLMEITLNLAWALCSLGLIWFWMRCRVPSRTSRYMQVLALAIVVLLLLPVISLSDDLAAWQSPAEADSSLRRAIHRDEVHPSILPTTFGMPEFQIGLQRTQWISLEIVPTETEALPASFLGTSHFGRPPPQA
jgi:hypothetical protein